MLWFLSLILSLTIIVFIRKRVPKYSPASIFTLFWCIQIFIILLLFSNILIFNYFGIIYILLCVLIYDVGYILAKLKQTEPSSNYIIKFRPEKARRIYICMLLLSFFGVYYSIHANGFNPFSIMDFQSILDMSHQNSVERYSGVKEGALERIFSINSSTTAIFGGIFLYSFEGKKKILSYLAILPAIISGLAQGAKMGIITNIFLYLIGILVGCQLFNKAISINFKILFKGIIIFILFLALMVMTMMFRIGRFDIDTMFVVFGRATSYILGHLPAFDIWFSSHEDSIFNLALGGKTIFGITNTLGLLERKQGLFEEAIRISNDGSLTNVYSYFRIMIEDFGVIGSLFYMYIMGCLSRIVYDNFIRKHHLYFTSTLMCGIYFFISWSFATSVYVYMTYIAMIIYIYIIFRATIIKRFSSSITTCEYSSKLYSFNSNSNINS